MANNERTGWRDLRLSERHRKLGPFSAIDIDFLEFHNDEPFGIFEYKHEDHHLIFDKNIKIQQILSNRSSLPFFIVRYADDFSWYNWIAGNEHAKFFIRDKNKKQITEAEHQQLLAKLRGWYNMDLSKYEKQLKQLDLNV